LLLSLVGVDESAMQNLDENLNVQKSDKLHRRTFKQFLQAFVIGKANEGDDATRRSQIADLPERLVVAAAQLSQQQQHKQAAAHADAGATEAEASALFSSVIN
jgi:hypothetical protein